MAVTVSLYNQTAKKFANKEYDFTTLKLMLLNNTPTFNAAHTGVSSVSSDEVSGNGWDAGGELLTSVVVSTVNTNDASLDADDLSITATGGNIGPAYKAVLYDDTGDQLIAFIDFGEAKEAGVGTPLLIQWHASGIIGWTVT
jgi:hypothetical protein